MLSTGRMPDLLAAAGAIGVGIAAGAAVTFGGLPMLGLGAAGATAAVVFAIAVNAALVDLTRIAYWAMLAGAFLVAANGMRRGSLTYSDVIIVAALLPAALAGIVRNPRIPWWLPAGALLLAASLVVSEMFPVLDKTGDLFRTRNLGTGQRDTSSGIALAARLIVACAVIPLAVALAASTKTRARGLATAWLLGVGASCLVGVLAAFTSVDLQETLTGKAYAFEAWRGAAGRYTGLNVHPTLFGVCAAIALPVALARMADRRAAWRYGPLVALYCAAALISGSRAALIGAVLAFVLVFAWRARGRRQIVALILVGGALAYMQAPQLTDSLSAVQRLVGGSTQATLSARHSDSDRLGSFAEGIGYFLDRPLTGSGFEAIRGAHNTWLQLASSGGVLALAGWALIMFGALRLGWRMRDDGDALGLCASLVVFLAAGLSMNAVLDRFLYMPVALILALQFARARQAGSCGTRTP